MRRSVGILTLTLLLCIGMAVTTVSATQDQAYRPPATSTIAFVDDTGFAEFAQKMMPSAGPPDFGGALKAAVKPITEQIGAFFYVLLFGVPYLVLWIRQKNLIVPSLLGIILGAWMIVKIPAAYTIPAVILLAVIVAGGLYGIYAKRT